MNYRRMGRTDLQVSEIVFGGGWVGGIVIHKDDETKVAAVRRALDAGINWIDTAAAYGDGQSETALGWILPELAATPYLSTKFRIDTDDLSDIPGQIEASLQQSLGRLQRQSVDLLQLHNEIQPQSGGGAIGVDAVLRTGGVADALDRLREQGLFRFAGFTSLGDAGCCCQLIDSGRFDTAQVYYNLLNPSAGRTMPSAWQGHPFDGVIAACRAQDMGVMAIRIFAAGIAASKQRTGREAILTTNTDVPTEERRAESVFGALGDDHGSRAQAALRFVLANQDIACAVIGMAELQHLEEALAAADMGPLSDDVLSRLAPVYESNFGLG